jgi:hypothetical protein
MWYGVVLYLEVGCVFGRGVGFLSSSCSTLPLQPLASYPLYFPYILADLHDILSGSSATPPSEAEITEMLGSNEKINYIMFLSQFADQMEGAVFSLSLATSLKHSLFSRCPPVHMQCIRYFRCTVQLAVCVRMGSFGSSLIHACGAGYI